MHAPALPTGFWLCVAGFVLCAGIALVVLTAFVRRVRLARVRSFARDQRGTTIVSFGFVLFILVQLTVLIWQLGFMVSAYLVIDYAAFAAARCAVVLIPPHVSDEEPALTVANVTLEGSEKGREIAEAAAIVCQPISARHTQGAEWNNYTPTLTSLKGLPGADFLDALDPYDFATRYAYAMRNTHVRLVVPGTNTGAHAFHTGDTVTVEVTHDFSLRVPFAARVFGRHREPEGFVTSLTSSATILFEGGNEKVPKGAPEGAQP